MAKPFEDGVNQGRSSQFIVEKRTELGYQNRIFYTKIFWKFPN